MGQGLPLCGDRHTLFVPPPSLAGGVRTPLREPLTHTLSPIYSATQFVFSQNYVLRALGHRWEPVAFTWIPKLLLNWENLWPGVFPISNNCRKGLQEHKCT